eukprot:SAG11_NODE_785_length_7173_cov_4.452926_4_plen_332_part_00
MLLMPTLAVLLQAALSAGAAAAASQAAPEQHRAQVATQFDITKYGAKEGGTALCTGAIKQAVAAAAAAPPAEVLVPAGRFLTGAFGLASGVKLRLAKGAVLLASTEQADYPAAGWPSPLQGWNWDPALLDTANATDTGIVGEGAIDGQQAKWVKGYDRHNNFLQPITWAKVNGCKGECRPKLVRFTDCSRVTVSGVTLRNSPDWTQLYRRCSEVLLQGLTVTGSQLWGNNDGVDFESGSGIRVCAPLASLPLTPLSHPSLIPFRIPTSLPHPALIPPSRILLPPSFLSLALSPSLLPPSLCPGNRCSTRTSGPATTASSSRAAIPTPTGSG